MAVEILLPKSFASVEAGMVHEWHARDGDRVTEGQPLYTLKFEDSTQPVEAPATGILKINASLGQTYDVGTVLGYIE